jgi:hypothetical protein
VSGLTYLDGTSRSNLPSPLLAVHDAKTRDDPTAGTTGPAPRVSIAQWAGEGLVRGAVAWPVGEAGAEVPNDLEAVAAVPGMPGHAILAESGGRLIHVTVAMQAGSWRLSIVTPAPRRLPHWGGKDHEEEGGEPPECEAFALTSIDGHLVAVWGERGTKAAAGSVFFAPFDLEKGADLDGLGAVPVRVPEPTGSDVRDVSEIAVDAQQHVYFAAADDEGKKGPFTSAIYRLGTLRSSKAGLYLEREPEPVIVRRVAAHKIEGLVAGADGRFTMASDDEQSGGWLRVERSAAPCDPTPQPR